MVSRISRILTLSLGFVLLAATKAQASPPAPIETVGDMLKNIVLSTSNFTNLISLVGYLMGSILTFTGIYKFKEHIDNPMQTKMSEGVKRWFAAGLMFSMPFLTGALRGTLFRDSLLNPEIDNATGFTDANLSNGGMDELIVNFIGNIMQPALGLLTAFTYIAGFGLLLVGISRLTKRMEEGPRGPGGAGTVMTFIASGALFSFANSAGAFLTTVFGDNHLMTNLNISDDVLSAGDDRDRVEKVVEGLMLFIMLVGYIAFIRGWFALKAFADGQSGATMAQGLTFLLGGTLAINMGQVVNILQTTVGVSGITFAH